MDNVSLKLSELRFQIQRAIENIKENALASQAKSMAYPEEAQDLTPDQLDMLQTFIAKAKTNHSVPLDDALCLIKAMSHLKAQNMEL